MRQKLLESQAVKRGVATWPSDEELSKLSDEHKEMLAQKCVDLLMRKSSVEATSTEVVFGGEQWDFVVVQHFIYESYRPTKTAIPSVGDVSFYS